MTVLLVSKAKGRAGLECRLGRGDYVFSFFSTVSYHLEGLGHWGERFPRLLLDLCDHGIVESEYLDDLRAELSIIQQELRAFSVKEAVYDIGDLRKPIPWELLPGADRHDLSMPWVTPRGADSFFDVFEENMRWAKKDGGALLLLYPLEESNRETLFERKEKGRVYWLQE